MAAKLSVLLVDDHPVVRAGLSWMLADSTDFELAGEASNPAEALSLTKARLPDYAVLDLVMGGRDDVGLIDELLTVHRPLRILVYSSHHELTYAPRALRAGAWGYLEKSQALPAVEAALQSIRRGERVVSAAVRNTLMGEALGRPSGSAPLEGLSSRELQILRLVAEGRTLGEMALELNLSPKTVGTYRERLKNKLRVENARQLTLRARGYLMLPGA